MQALLLTGFPFPEHAHMALCRLNQLLRRAGEQDGPVVDDHDLVAHRLHILDDMGGKQNQAILRFLRE